MPSTVGIERIRIAILKDDETIDTSFGTNGIFDIDARTSLGATKASITGLAPQISRIWGSNESVGVSSRGTGQVSATIGANSIPADIIAKITGMDKDSSTGGYTLGSQSRAPYAVMEAISTDERTGKDVHFAIFKGMFTPEEQNLQTNTQNQERTTDSLTFTGVNRISDKLIYGTMWESDPNHDLDKWNSFVFPTTSNGATPAASANGVTGSSNTTPSSSSNGSSSTGSGLAIH